jgi:hypothetical protein
MNSLVNSVLTFYKLAVLCLTRNFISFLSKDSSPITPSVRFQYQALLEEKVFSDHPIRLLSCFRYSLYSKCLIALCIFRALVLFKLMKS